ncbi:MAG: HEAT repeat domain-containing protein [Bacillota bacterium]
MIQRSLFIVTSLALLACVSPAQAQNLDSALLRELNGKAPARQVTPEQRQNLYDQAIKSLLISHDAQHDAASAQALIDLESIYLYASRPGAEPERWAMSNAAVALLVPATPKESRVRLIQILERIGRAESVPVLKQCLADADADIRESARRALQHNPTPDATTVLREALAQAKDAAWKIGLINALGYRKDVGSSQAFLDALNSGDPALAMAGAKALGNIGGDAAITALTGALKASTSPVRPVVLDAYLRCAERLIAEKKNDQAYALYQAMYVPTESSMVRIGALRGMMVASPAKAMPLLVAALNAPEPLMRGAATDLLTEDTSPERMKFILAQLPNTVPDVQVLLLGVVTSAGDASARAVVLSLAGHSDDRVRAAALGALGRVGNAGDIALLAKAASDRPAVAAAAGQGLVRLSGSSINDAIVSALTQADPKAKVLLIGALANRRATVATPALIAALTDKDPSVSQAAVDALRAIGDEKSLAPLISLYVKAEASQRQSIEQAVMRIADRVPDADARFAPLGAALDTATGPSRLALLRLAGMIRGEKAIAALHEARNSSDADVQDAAIRSLAESPDLKAAPELLDIARNAKNERHKILAARGYIRLAGTIADQPAEQLEMYKQILAVAGAAEKKLAVSSVRGMASLEALTVATSCLADSDVREEAGMAVASIGERLARRRTNADAVRASLQKVLDSTPSDRVRAEVQRVLGGLR